MRNTNEDTLGFEIIGLKEAITDDEKLTILEKHLVLIEGLTNEAKSNIENRISKLKYPELNKT